jgi:TP901 family phage tail tape measure protein
MANSLLVQLGFVADKQSITGTISGIDKIDSAISDLHKKIKQTFAIAAVHTFASGIKSLGNSIKTAFSKSYNFAEEFAESGDKIAKTSRLVGLSVKDYQAFSSAAQHAGMSTEEMDGALRKFNVNLGKARSGDKNSLKMFDSILGGKSISSFKDSTSLIAAIADGYQKLGSAEQKAFVSQELFGKSGLKMSELLSQGDEGIKKLIEDFESHGGGFSEEGAKNAEAFDDALQDMRETVNSLKISVAQELFPTFIDLFKTVQTFIKDNREEIIPIVKEIFGRTAELVKSLLPRIPAILNMVLSVVRAIGPGTIVFVTGFISLLPAIGKIIFGLSQMGPILKFVVVGVKSVTTWGWAIVNAFKIAAAVIGGPTLAMIGLVVAAVVSWGIAIKSIYDNWNLVGDAVEWVWTTIKESLEWWWNGFKSLFVDPVWNFFQALPGAISSLIDGFLDGFKTIGQMVYELGGKIYDTIVGSVKDAWSAAKGVLSNIPFVGKLFDDSKSSDASSSSSLGASVAQAVSESHTTTTSRFAVDFKNMPRGVQVTAPDHGDFDYSRGYVLAGM